MNVTFFELISLKLLFSIRQFNQVFSFIHRYLFDKFGFHFGIKLLVYPLAMDDKVKKMKYSDKCIS